MICRSVIVHHAGRLSDSYVCHSDRLVMKYHLYYPIFFLSEVGLPMCAFYGTSRTVSCPLADSVKGCGSTADDDQWCGACSRVRVESKLHAGCLEK
jgi:hypothetical protein